MKIINLCLAALLILMLSCSSDDEARIKCVGIWEIELLHDGASAEIVDGKLRLRIENPQTDHDIRLTQRQTDYHNSRHLGIYVYFENMENVRASGKNDFDMALNAWYAYNYAPEDEIAGLSIGKFGVRGRANGVVYQGHSPDVKFLSFGGSKESISFTGVSGTFKIPLIQPDPKTLYLDFGIVQNTGTGKSSLIEVDITEVQFGQPDGMDELLNDKFDCNSLK